MASKPTPDDPHALLLELMRRDFAAFLRKAYPWISGGEAMLWNWHLDAIAHQLDRVRSGDNRRLLVTLPPRNGKSKTISVAWVAWMLGKEPTANFVCVSYSNELSSKLARDCLSIIQSPWYRELFPRTIISPKRSASGDFETTAGGGRLATSVTGTLTGRGGDIIILGDVIKPEEANSEATRESVNNWYKSTLASRLNDKASGAIITVMQRLHEHDLAGMLIESGEWHQLSLPAIATADEIVPLTRGRAHLRKAGDILHSEREPQAVLDELKRSMGSMAFAAQYQQDPVPAVGNMIKAEWLKSYDSFDRSQCGQIVQSWDTASKDNPHNDYSVCITAHVRGKYVTVLDVTRRRMQFPELLKTASALAREHKATAMLVEDAASGAQLIQTLRVSVERGVPVPIPCRPEGDKISRVAGISAMVEAGQLILPTDAPWLAEFRSELLAFPNARFDDQVDALSQLLIWVRRNDCCASPCAPPTLFWLDGDGQLWKNSDDDLQLCSEFDEGDTNFGYY